MNLPESKSFKAVLLVLFCLWVFVNAPQSEASTTPSASLCGAIYYLSATNRGDSDEEKAQGVELFVRIAEHQGIARVTFIEQLTQSLSVMQIMTRPTLIKFLESEVPLCQQLVLVSASQRS